VLPNLIPALILLEKNRALVISDADAIQFVDPTPGAVLIVR
jgi:hypothetical protein